MSNQEDYRHKNYLTMKLNRMILGAVMFMAASVTYAQQPAADANEKGMPQQAELFSMAGQLVKYGHQTKSALPLIQALQIYKSLNVTTASDEGTKVTEGMENASVSQSKTDVVGFNEEQILADATKYAEGNKSLLALIADAKKTTRGAYPGPVRRESRVDAQTTDIWTIKFRGGEDAYVVVSGDGDTDLDLYIYDENGNLIDSDTDSSDDCVCSFHPRWTGNFRIKIKNLGHVYNRYILATN